MTRPYGPADPYSHPRGSALSRGFVPLALITLGVVFLLSNLVPEEARGGLVVLGLGRLGVASLGPLASWGWITGDWPGALILRGAWILGGESVPAPVR